MAGLLESGLPLVRTLIKDADVTGLGMKKTVVIALAIASLVLAGCSAGSEGTNESSSGSAVDLSSTAPVRSKVPVPLRAYSAAQIVQVLRGLHDSEGKAPSFITDDASMRDQTASTPAQKSLLSKMQVVPEGCASLLDFAPPANAALTKGMGLVPVKGALAATIGVVVDSAAGHKLRNEESRALVSQCGTVTLRSGGKDTSMSMKLVPLDSASEDSFAITATAKGDTETKIVAVTATAGSVMINAAAVSIDIPGADFDESEAISELQDLAEQALDKFAVLPEPSAADAVTAAGTPEEVKLRSALVGSWSGPVTGDTSSYHVEATISQNASGLMATVNYPELNCTATWTETDISIQDVDMLERVQTGQSRCVDNVKLALFSVANANVIVAFESKTKPNLQALMKPE